MDAQLDHGYWDFAVRYASNALLEQGLGRISSTPPFGSHVAVRRLKPVEGEHKTWKTGGNPASFYFMILFVTATHGF
eukprot:4873508-Amphidinium_carterae.2